MLICIGITENFLQKTAMTYSEAGIALPAREQWFKLIAFAIVSAGLWLALIKPYAAALEVIFPSAKKWVFSDTFWKTILAHEGISPIARHAVLIYTLALFSIAEEFVFRGFLFKYLAKHSSAFNAVFWSSLLFSLVHLSPLAVVLTLPLGMILGFLMLRTGNIVAPIAAHFIFNTALIYIYGTA